MNPTIKTQISLQVNHAAFKKVTASWVIYTLGLLVLVTLAGFILRLFPFGVLSGINYENLVHAHSHLAFLGWAYNALFLGLVWTFIPKEGNLLSKYHTLFWITQVATLSMFVAFLLDGYQAPAIIALTLHTVTAYVFIVYFLKDSKTQPVVTLADWMMKGAFACLFISTLGPFAIPIIQTQSMNADHIKMAVNFYLHFQYNGWFVFGFACYHS